MTPPLNDDLAKKFDNLDFEEKIVGYINNRMLASETAMRPLIGRWETSASQYNAEIIQDPEVQARANNSGDNPIYVPLRIPYTYAAVQTYLTFLLALFTKRQPMFQLDGRTAEDIQRARLMETILHNNAINRGYVIPIHTWLRDGLIYNRGIIWRDWYKETSRTLRTKQNSVMGVAIGEPQQQIISQIVDEGNDLFTSSPFDTYFDPGVTMDKYQEGEFVGRVYYQTWTKVLEKMEERFYWDKRRLIPVSPATAWKNRSGPTHPGENEQSVDSAHRKSIEIIDKVIRIVPSEWGLGTHNYPQYWRFIIANGKTVLRAEHLPHMFEFPCYAIEPEFDGRSLETKGMVEMMAPLQELLSWLINSHMDSVRKSINNKFVIDPSMVEWEDVTENRPYIRLSQRGMGRGATAAIYQLKVYDATQTHLKDIELVTDLLTRISAATENYMGMVNNGGRKTATEVRTANSLAGSRIEKTALVIGHQGWIPLSRGLVNGVQNNLSQEMFYRDFRLEAEADPIGISPDAIKNGAFNYPPIDPTIPVDRFQLAQTWGEILGAIGENEQMAQTYDMKKMFEHWAELGGVKNLNQFRVQAQVQPANAEGANNEQPGTIPLAMERRQEQQ